MTTSQKLTEWIKVRKHQYLAIGVLLIVLIIIFVAYHATHKADAVTTTGRRGASQQVTVATVQSLSPENEALSVIGSVTSVNQATVLSQAAGEIVSLYAQIGDQVAAGQTIATIENSSQQAAVLQAQGAYDMANAALVKASGGAQGTLPDGSQTAANTQASLSASLQNAYTSIDDAVHTKADALFTNPDSLNPTLIQFFGAVDYNLAHKIQSERASLNTLLTRDQTLASAESSDDLKNNISTMTDDLQTVQSFLGDLAQDVNEVQTQNEINSNAILPTATIVSYQTSIAAARTEVANALTSLTGTLNTYDTSGSNGQVEEELGALDAAKATLAKTIIKSPISGTIVDLPITEGDYVSTGNEVAEVSNPGNLKIITHVSATDAKTLSAGSAATINGTVPGTITQVSPAIDPQTGTIEVDVAVSGNQQSLTDGDSVTVDLSRSTAEVTQADATDDSASSTASVIIPIVSLKITPTGPEVFTVDATKNTLVAHPVSIGSILGQNIVVTTGLTPSLVIVTDARGLTVGQSVSVKKAQ